MVRGWESLPARLGAVTNAYYDFLVAFVLEHKEHGTWQAIAPGYAADWLTAVAATPDE